MEQDRRRADQLGGADRRLARVPLGAAPGELLPRHGDGDQATEGLAGRRSMDDRRRAHPRRSLARPRTGLGVRDGGVLPRCARGRPARRADRRRDRRHPPLVWCAAAPPGRGVAVVADGGDDRLGAPPSESRARRPGRRDARARGRDVPGCLSQPARRPVPARRRSRRGAGGDAGDRISPPGTRCPRDRPTCGVSRRGRRGRRRVRACSLGR